MVAVTDTGSGMSAEVIEQAFEPFFTTKPEGRGTGLGLSMVYGFVKQSGGHINIESAVGQGSIIKLYLPRSMQAADLLSEAAPIPVSGGNEMILVAEDDEHVRETVVAMLNDLGYRVLKSKDAQSALSIIESGMPIDLLFTDVIMPGPMKSTELARKARERMPNLAVLFTSGYTEDAFTGSGSIGESVELLSKPYSREALARKLRHALADATRRNPAPCRSPIRRARLSHSSSSRPRSTQHRAGNASNPRRRCVSVPAAGRQFFDFNLQMPHAGIAQHVGVAPHFMLGEQRQRLLELPGVLECAAPLAAVGLRCCVPTGRAARLERLIQAIPQEAGNQRGVRARFACACNLLVENGHHRRRGEARA